VKKTHIIKYLLIQCAKIDKDFENIDVKELSEFAVDIRYAELSYIPDMNEVRFYYNLAKRIRNMVFKKLGIKENNK